MITNYDEIEKLFNEIDKVIENKINLFVIGGAVLLQQDLKDATKDIDIIVNTEEEFIIFQKALETLGFKPKITGKEYEHMDINQIFQNGDFRIDLFYKEVCGEFSLTKEMVKRANTILNLEKLNIAHCSNEDIFLFKTMTEREGDLEDCIRLGIPGINWEIIIKELQNQIKKSNQDVWITWVGERLDLLEDKGLVIPIMNQFNKLRNQYFKKIQPPN